MNETEFNAGCAALGVGPDVTLESLERAGLKQNLALIRTGSTDEREQLRLLQGKLAAHLKARTPVAPAAGRPAAAGVAGRASRPVPVYVPPPPDPKAELLNPSSFDSWLVNLLALPLVTGLAWLVNVSPFGFSVQGFHVWMHEFGHATVAWLSGRRALPLPFGWTSVEPQKSLFVYLGVLFLLGVLFVTGWKERKIWPMVIAGALAPLQFYCSWLMPEYRTDLWFSFGGVGGEFYLSAAFMAAFYVHLPEKFRWGVCRYVFLFIGASSFLNILLFWRQVRHGTEGIPWGSLVNGEEDAGGDMNILRDDHGWNNHHIMGTYNSLGTACMVALVIIWAVFALRLDRIAGQVVGRWWPE